MPASFLSAPSRALSGTTTAQLRPGCAGGRDPAIQRGGGKQVDADPLGETRVASRDVQRQGHRDRRPQAYRVEPWRFLRFPDLWERYATLLNGLQVLDPTNLCRNDSWWMLGMRRVPNRDADLWLLQEPHSLGAWTPNPTNPVKIDVTSSRRGGTPFVLDGVLYRPAQDCSDGYGSAIVINRVDRLDDTGFTESAVRRVRVGGHRYPSGSHTLAIGAGLVAVDSRRDVLSRHRSGREVRARLAKAL